MINITKQLTRIKDQTKYLSRLLFKVNNQMRHFKQLHLIKGIIKELSKIKPLQQQTFNPTNLATIPANDYLSYIGSLRNKIAVVGELLQDNIQRVLLVQFNTLAYSSLSVVQYNLHKVQKKVAVVQRIAMEARQHQQQLQ